MVKEQTLYDCFCCSVREDAGCTCTPYQCPDCLLCSIDCECRARDANEDENGQTVIPLTKGMFAIVDPEDVELLSAHKWHASKSQGAYYASAGIYVDGEQVHQTMHRLVKNNPEGLYIDHINGNTLDNRKSNLRVCTPTENRINSKVRKDNKSGYKGVHQRGNRWWAELVSKGKRYRFGSFLTPEDAAKAYDRAARKYHGEFARTNF
jgi:hypothetical protein